MKERHSSSHSFPPIKMRPERDILLTEAISNNFCQPTQPGPRSSCAICMVISTGAGDWKNEKCLWNSGWAPLPTWRTQGLCTGWPHWAEAQGRWRCHPQWIHDWAALQGVGARALLGRLCRQGCHVEPHVHPGTATQAVSDILQCDTLQHQSVLWNQGWFWMLLYLFGFSCCWDLLFPKKSNGCCFQKFI